MISTDFFLFLTVVSMLAIRFFTDTLLAVLFPWQSTDINASIQLFGNMSARGFIWIGNQRFGNMSVRFM